MSRSIPQPATRKTPMGGTKMVMRIRRRVLSILAGGGGGAGERMEGVCWWGWRCCGAGFGLVAFAWCDVELGW